MLAFMNHRGLWLAFPEILTQVHKSIHRLSPSFPDLAMHHVILTQDNSRHSEEIEVKETTVDFVACQVTGP